MKKIYLSLASVGLFGMMSAQTFVSTTAENKNVVLEEFTGIYCTFCPDGHKRAQDLKDANPGDVVLVNIHAGGYANPNSGDPDFRTPFGAAIDAQSDLTGYPAGTVNRRVFSGDEMTPGGTAMGRADWAPNAPTVLGEASYVNVAAQASLDVQTRVLTVDVEAYFTGSTAPASVNLNLALMQNNVEGPQTGSSANPAQVLPNGNYSHNHMLRHLLTGQWGDVISNTAMGTTYTNQYTYTIPADLNGVAYELGELEIAVFIAEGQQNIITGEMGTISYVLPPGSQEVDLASSTTMAGPASICDGTVTPEITVENTGNNAVASYEISYMINGGTAVNQTISTPLAAGASATHTFPTAVLPAGTNVVTYMVEPILATDVELSTGDNTSSSDAYFVIPAAAFATQHTEGFESNSLGDAAPSNAIAANPNDIAAYVVDNGINSSVSQALGGFGNSDNSFRWDFYSIQNGESSIIFEKIDLSQGSNHVIKFNHAYAQYQNENDMLEINISTDCGATWSNVFAQGGSSLATVPANTNRFYPAIDEWAANSIDVSAYDGENEVIIEFKGVSAYGNDLYVDDIQILNSTTSSVEENETATVSVYPNPSNGITNVSLDLANDSDVQISVYNTVGAQVLNNVPVNYASGSSLVSLDLSGLANGIYYLNAVINGEIIVKPITIQK